MNNKEARGLEKPGHSWAFCSEIQGTVFNTSMIKLAPIQKCAETKNVAIFRETGSMTTEMVNSKIKKNETLPLPLKWNYAWAVMLRG